MLMFLSQKNKTLMCRKENGNKILRILFILKESNKIQLLKCSTTSYKNIEF